MMFLGVVLGFVVPAILSLVLKFNVGWVWNGCWAGLVVLQWASRKLCLRVVFVLECLFVVITLGKLLWGWCCYSWASWGLWVYSGWFCYLDSPLDLCCSFVVVMSSGFIVYLYVVLIALIVYTFLGFRWVYLCGLLWRWCLLKWIGFCRVLCSVTVVNVTWLILGSGFFLLALSLLLMRGFAVADY